LQISGLLLRAVTCIEIAPGGEGDPFHKGIAEIRHSFARIIPGFKDIVLLRQQVQILLDERRREREQTQEQVDDLKAALKTAQDSPSVCVVSSSAISAGPLVPAPSGAAGNA
jgi:hypothetical protein